MTNFNNLVYVTPGYIYSVSYWKMNALHCWMKSHTCSPQFLPRPFLKAFHHVGPGWRLKAFPGLRTVRYGSPPRATERVWADGSYRRWAFS